VRSRRLGRLGGILWRLIGILWAFAHIPKCRRAHTLDTVSAVAHISTSVRYYGVMTERWMIGRVRIIRYPLRRQSMFGWTWVKEETRTVLEVFNGRSMWVFERLPK
jgi:hypothetical protein